MASAVVQLTVTSRRMLSKKQAAAHCGRSIKRFEIECPVLPIEFVNGDRRYDVRELDVWLDALKNKSEDSATILNRLVVR